MSTEPPLPPDAPGPVLVFERPPGPPDEPRPLRAKAPVRRLRQRRASTVTARVALDLAELALELRLTAKARLLAEELIIRCNGNVAEAAAAAGMSRSRAIRTVALPAFQSFLQTLRTVVVGPVADELELTLYESAHALARLTEIAEGQVPGTVTRAVEVKAADGSIEPDAKVTNNETYPILDATRDILAHYKVGQLAPGAGGNRTMIINVGKLAPEQLDAIGANVKALLSETE